MRIAQVANFVAPHSGGIRTVLHHLATGYHRSGHEVVQVVPGVARRRVPEAWGYREELAGRPIPRTGYRVLHPAPVRRLLAALTPDRIEVHDRLTLRGLGRWAAGRGVPALVVSHERLDRWAAQWLPAPVLRTRAAGALIDRSNAALVGSFATVVCTTGWAAAEFDRLPGVSVRIVPLGVDPAGFGPNRFDPRLRPPGGEPLLVMVSRLSREKRPDLALRTVETLAGRGIPVRLVVLGDGPMRAELAARAAERGLPVRFLGHRPPPEVAGWLATADVAIAPGPVETFCLAAVEALASGTPVVGNAASAIADVIGPAGLIADGTPDAFADAVEKLLHRPEIGRRAAARTRAAHFGWAATVRDMLQIHEAAGAGEHPIGTC